MASFLFSREEISQLKIEPPTSSLRCNNTYQTCQMSSFKLVVHIFGPGAGHPRTAFRHKRFANSVHQYKGVIKFVYNFRSLPLRACCSSIFCAAEFRGSRHQIGQGSSLPPRSPFPAPPTVYSNRPKTQGCEKASSV